jgi:Tol biopolymer transport system component/DNA-binding winged helix-turn-helix (wHTH) protein
MPGTVRFGIYELDPEGMILFKQGTRIRLQEQPFRVLLSLIERPGEIVTREQLKERIWAQDTFVDFDQSLNKAVNRLRDVLNDDAGQPRYIETVPRRGYRFVAPVTGLTPAEVLPPALPEPSNIPSNRATIAIAVAGGLLTWGLVATIVRTKPVKPPLRRARRMTTDGTSIDPALSRDGKLLAYSTPAGGEVAHIWLRQTAGGEAIQVTRSTAGDSQLSFSPDGTRIAYRSEIDGGGIYVVPSFGSSEPRLVAKGGFYPSFSPDGERLLYQDGSKSAIFVVSIHGGAPSSAPSLWRSFVNCPRAFWAPSGEQILYFGSGNSPERGEFGRWRIGSVGAGAESKVVSLGDWQIGPEGVPFAHAWTQTNDGHQWIVYSAPTGDSRSLFRVGVSPRGKLDPKPEQLTSGSTVIENAALSQDGKLAFASVSFTGHVYAIPVNFDRGEALQNASLLTLTGAQRNHSPSLSRDGRWMAYASTNLADTATTIHLKNLVSGTDQLLVDRAHPFEADIVSISPDGSNVAFSRLDNNEIGSYIVSAAGGSPEKICANCIPRGFSSDGSRILIQRFAAVDRIAVVDLPSKKEQEFLRDPKWSLYHAFFSWDDRWVVFKKHLDERHGQLLIAPVRNGLAGGQAQWIAATDGRQNDDKPQFSPDSNTLYFTSDRDGHLCIWGLRLNHATKRPEGAPFALQHFHNAMGFETIRMNLSVASDKIVTNLMEPHGDIWLVQVD